MNSWLLVDEVHVGALMRRLLFALRGHSAACPIVIDLGDDESGRAGVGPWDQKATTETAKVAPGAPMAASEACVARARCVVFFDDEHRWFAGEVVSSRAATDNPRPGEPPSDSARGGGGGAERMYLVRFDDGDEVGDLRLEELRHPRDGVVAPTTAMAPMTAQSAAGSAAAGGAAVAGAVGVPCTSASPDASTSATATSKRPAASAGLALSEEPVVKQPRTDVSCAAMLSAVVPAAFFDAAVLVAAVRSPPQPTAEVAAAADAAAAAAAAARDAQLVRLLSQGGCAALRSRTALRLR